jgi:hypothetical protein
MANGFVRPSVPYAPGKAPTGVEYEFTAPNGGARNVVTPMDEPVEWEEAEAVRYRFLWGSKPGAWNDRGVAWQMPS